MSTQRQPRASNARFVVPSKHVVTKSFEKSLELEQRICRVEQELQDMLRGLRALQAQLDHLAAKNGR